MPWAIRWALSSPGPTFRTFDQAKPLLKRILTPKAYALMDKGYDSDAIREYVNQLGDGAVIALHLSRSQKPAFDQHLYRERHRIENLFARLKHFRRIATRYEKLLSSFSAMLTLACILREICRRTRVVGTFPDDASALLHVSARLRHIVGKS